MSTVLARPLPRWLVAVGGRGRPHWSGQRGGLGVRPAASAAVRHFDRAMQRAMAIVLLSAVVQTVAVAAAGHDFYPPWWWLGPGPVSVAVGCLAAVLCWLTRFDRWWRLGAALVVGACAALTAVALPPAFGVGSALLPLAVLTLAAVGFLERPLAGFGVGLALIGPFMVTLVVVSPGRTGEHVAVLAVLAFSALAAIGGGYLARLIAAREEQALACLHGAIVADHKARATWADRRRSQRELHDTVLNTLTALGRGSLADSPGLRTLCAADAALLRDMLRREASVRVRVPDLDAQLRVLAHSFDTAGFPVRLRSTHCGPLDLPAPVVSALVSAVREALNNARSHSGAASAEVEARRDGDTLTIVVRDLGRGSAEPAVDRLGIRGSILERMGEVGGLAEVRSPPGAGTSVHLCWPA